MTTAAAAVAAAVASAATTTVAHDYHVALLKCVSKSSRLQTSQAAVTTVAQAQEATTLLSARLQCDVVAAAAVVWLATWALAAQVARSLRS